MIMDKVVSVIIPMYNSEKTIKRALDSVINQDYKNFEIIVVNDGSIDGSRNIVEEYIKVNDAYNIRLINQDNAGVSIARNNGIKMASGDYVALLDSDDYWEKNKLYEQIKILESNHDIYLLGTWTKTIKEKENVNKIKYISFRRLLFRNVFTTSSVIIRKDVFSSIGYFNTSKKYSEDYDLWLRIGKKHKMAFYTDELTYYSTGTMGLSSKLINMEKGELSNYYDLYKSKDIGLFLFVLASIFSIVKFLKRLLYSFFKN